MYAQFRYLDGAALGQTRVAANDFATVGRHPGSDVPFDPGGDLQVSVRHAAVFKQGGGFLIRDLGSTNGTFVNGKRVRGDRPLEPGDVIQFGPTGPRVAFSVASEVPRTAMAAEPAPAVGRPRIRRPRARTTDRIQRVVRRETSRWKWIAVAALALAALAVSQATWRARRQHDALESQRAALLARVDDLLARLERSRPAPAGVASALRTARREVVSLRAGIAAGAATEARLDTLTRAVVDETERHGEVLLAAGLDPAAAVAANRPAVAVIVAEMVGGPVLSGTGFAVQSTGDAVLVVTAKHLVRDSAGTPAARLAVIFDRTGQAFRATLVRVLDSADLALLAVRIRGGAPVVAGIADSATAGAPVILLGYPGGLDSLGNWRALGVRARSTVGTVAGAGGDLLAIDGYGSPGSSGSPVLRADGRVVGVVSGGDPGAPGRLVYAVPARLVRRLVPPA